MRGPDGQDPWQAPRRSSGPGPWADRWADRLLSRFLDRWEREALLGDLAEERSERRAAGGGGPAAWAWWGLELMRSAGPLAVWAWRRRRRRRRERTDREERMESWALDMRYALRSLAKSAGLSAVVVATLALGVGAATTVFTVVDNTVLRPFSFPEPERLVGVGPVYPKLGRELAFWEVLSPAEFEDIRDGVATLERVVAWDMGNRAVTVGERSENLFSAFWWGDAFATLGVKPALGRGFTEQELTEGAPSAILSHRVWTSRFGADSALIGRAILVNGDPFTLVGVMPPQTLIYGTDLWLPMPVQPAAFPRGRRQFQVLGRLAEGATMEEARAELALLADRTEAAFAEEHPEYAGWSLVPATWTDINVRAFRPAGLALLGAVGFVLLLVCVNVASMLLSRAAARRREMAVRAALGARRGRILRQLLTESVVLGVLGAAGGLLVAVLAVRGLTGALAALSLPIPGEIGVDGRVLGFAAAAAVGTGLLFGLVPAWYAARSDVRGTLAADGRGTAGGRGRLRLQRAFVGVEVALALVLLVGGGLLVNSFIRLQSVDPGFDTSGLLTMRLTLAWERYGAGEMEPFLEELTRRLEEHPSIADAATTTQLPPQVFGRRSFWVEGTELTESELPSAFATLVSPDYFEVLGVEVVDGRPLQATDRPGAGTVAVINDAAARRYFPGGSAVGRRFKLGGPDADNPWIEVVGVVSSTRNRGLDVPPAPEIFASVRQLPGMNNQHFLVVRSEGAARDVLPVVRETVAAMDPQQPIYMIQTVDEAYAAASAQRRIAATALALFGLFALLLAAVGIYAVVSYGVSQRTREIGVRVALGADGGRVRRLVVGQALLPVAAGAVAGLVGAVALGRLLGGLLFEVGSTDPGTYVGVVGLFLLAAAAAGYIPARRASRLDPVVALREEGG